MRNLLLCVLGAIAITGCAAHDSAWRVRDQHGWPIQTWNANRLSVRGAPVRCVRTVYPGLAAANMRPVGCCDQQVSVNSWGDGAELCGGRREISMVNPKPVHNTAPMPPRPRPSPASYTPHAPVHRH